MNLWDDLLAAARNPRAHLWVNTVANPQPVGWRQVIKDAEAIAGGLRQRGVVSGDLVGTVLTNHQSAVSGVLGVWLAGAAVASLPVPARGMDLATYTAQLSALASSCSAPFLLTDTRSAAALNEGVNVDVLAWEQVLGPRRFAGEPPDTDKLAFVQYSSGSTSMPKGCMLTTGAIGAQLDLLSCMADAVPGEETVASWLPLSHDMGLFGCLLFAWVHGFTLVMSSPERFMHSPRTWFRDCADSAATLTAGTNQALRLAARTDRNAGEQKPLSLRVCVVGAERVEHSTLVAIGETYGKAGLSDTVLMPAYGLAEATLAVTATGPDEAPQTLSVDAAALADGVVREVDPCDPKSKLLVSAGSSCRGVSVRTRYPDRLSEICVRSPSLSHGYHNDPRETRARFSGGELLTGDLGFMRGSQLFVVGRLDDVLQVGGRNVYAAEIESVMSALDGVRTGCCVIVNTSWNTSSAVVVLAEVGKDRVDFGQLAAGMADLATRTAGVTLDECLFLARGTLPKTPSGKIQRYRAQNLASDEQFEPLARVALTAGS